MRRWIFWAVSAAMFAAAGSASAERVALLVGASDYEATAPLDNPINDIEAVGAALTAVGYAVELVRDPDGAALDAAIDAFRRRASDAEVALFYFAGHGMALDGDNYLIPTDARLAREEDARFEAVAVDDVMAAAGRARDFSIVIIDACRDNRFPGASRSGARGFRPAEARSRQLLTFSTAPGALAADGAGGDGPLSPFAQALVEGLAEPAAAALDVRVFLSGLAPRVSELSPLGQRPETIATGFGFDLATIADRAAPLELPDLSEPAAADPEIATATVAPADPAAPRRAGPAPGPDGCIPFAALADGPIDVAQGDRLCGPGVDPVRIVQARSGRVVYTNGRFGRTNCGPGDQCGVYWRSDLLFGAAPSPFGPDFTRLSPIR